MEETIIPLKFNRKLSTDEIDALITMLNDFTWASKTEMEIISLSAVAKRVSKQK